MSFTTVCFDKCREPDFFGGDLNFKKSREHKDAFFFRIMQLHARAQCVCLEDNTKYKIEIEFAPKFRVYVSFNDGFDETIKRFEHWYVTSWYRGVMGGLGGNVHPCGYDIKQAVHDKVVKVRLLTPESGAQ